MSVLGFLDMHQIKHNKKQEGKKNNFSFHCSKKKKTLSKSNSIQNYE
jgi:hypothetical protein